LSEKYKNGGFGYGHAKNALLEIIMDKFKKPRSKFHELMSNQEIIETELLKGSKKAKAVADSVLKKAKDNLGLN
jgi:tryptophanyl-tRNA synthetase